MKKARKRILLIAGLLCVVGLVIELVCLLAVGFDSAKLGTITYETNTYEISEAFDNIEIDIYTADICFLPSEDGACNIVCYEDEKVKHTAKVQNKTLVIDAVDTRKWQEHIGVSFEEPKLTIYLPETEYSSLKIKCDTSDIEMPKDFLFENVTLETDTGEIKWNAPVTGTLKLNGDTGSMEVNAESLGEILVGTTTGSINLDSVKVEGMIAAETDTGKIQLADVTGRNINAKSDTGKITLKNTFASGHCSVSSDTGDVNFENFDATSIVVKTDTGDVAGTLLSEKIFVAETETGDIDVPKTTTGGTCTITTSTGDIEISVGGR